MKRADLIRHLESHKCFFVREGSKHTLYRNSVNGSSSTVPRHREIKKQLEERVVLIQAYRGHNKSTEIVLAAEQHGLITGCFPAGCSPGLSAGRVLP